MKVSDLIERLTKLRTTYGNVDVHIYDVAGEQSFDDIDAELDEDGPQPVILLTAETSAEFADSPLGQHRRSEA